MFALLSFLFTCFQIAVSQVCEVNITQGVPWTANNITYNFARLDVTSDQYKRSPWQLQLTTPGPLDSTWQLEEESTGGNRSTANTVGYWQFLSPDNPTDFGVVVSTSAEDIVTAVRISGEDCSVNTGDLVSPPAAVESGLQPISFDGTRVIGTDGNPVVLKGINWFGLEAYVYLQPGDTFMHGLWAGSDSITKDWSTIVYRLQLLGFNAVRLPVNFQNLFNLEPAPVSQACNVDSAATVASSTTDPSVGSDGQSLPEQPVQPDPATQVPGQCSMDVPNDTVLNRFLYVMDFFARNGFYIMVDNHLNLDNTAIDDPDTWVDYWKQLATRITADPVASSYTMYDILNEPDSKDLRWEASDGKPGVGDLYLRAMDAIHEINPSAVFLLEGAGQTSQLTLCWGNGYITDESIISANGFSDPNPFFQELMGRPYLNNVAISPHYYGPSISLVSSGYSGAALYDKLSTSGGYLSQEGYCVGSQCKTFPIIVGETGSNLKDPRDLQFYESLRRYFKLEGDGDDGRHTAIDHVFWWSWNANSGDTKGIVLDDWTTINWSKVQLLEKLIDLKPWYRSQVQGGSIESAADNTIQTPQQTTFPFSSPQRGIVWDLKTLLLQNTTSTGDFGIVLQRLLAFGFGSVIIPFEFNDIASDDYLSGMVRPCEPTTVEEVVTAALPPGYNVSGLTYQLPAAAGVPVNYSSGVCNSFLSDVTGKARLLKIVETLLANNLTVVLQGRNAFAAEVAPSAWLFRWVDLAVSLVDMDSPNLCLDLTNTTGSPLQWQSATGRPGLSELYRSLIPALDNLLPRTNYFVEGLNGDDFSGGDTYFKNLQTLPWQNRVVALASKDALRTSSNLTTSLTYLANPGVCLTADKCHQYQVAIAFPTAMNYSDNATLLSTTSWYFAIGDVSAVQAGLLNLTAIGLRPWFYPRSAYSPEASYAIQGSTSVEAAAFTDQACSVNVTISAADLSAASNTNAVMELEMSNLQDTTLFPPWQLDVFSDAISSLTYNFEGTVVPSKAGHVSLTLTEYWQVLWPQGLNSLNTTLILDMQPPLTSNITVSLNSQNCSVAVVIT